MSIMSISSPVEPEQSIPSGHFNEELDSLPDIVQALSQAADRISRHAIKIPSPTSGRSPNSSRRPTQESASSSCSTITKPRELSFTKFCERVENNQAYANAHVVSLTCYKDVEGIPHEFLVAHVRKVDAPDEWIRLERVADFAHPTGWFSRLYPGLSKYNPNDKVKIAPEESDLLSQSGGIAPKEKLMFKGNRLSLKTFAMLLTIFEAESKTYTLRQKNCWFFCSVIIENLVDLNSNPIKVRNLSLGKDLRKQIQRKFFGQGFRCI